MAVSSIPGTGVYARAAEMAKTRYQQRVADLNQQRQRTFGEYGYAGNINDDGLVENLRVDPTAKYGKLQLLNRAQAMQGQEVLGDNIERGLGTGGGLASQRMNDARFGWGDQDSQLGRSLDDMLAGYTRTQQDSRYEYDQALWQAQLEAAQAAQQGGDYGYAGGGDDGGDYPDDGYPGDGSPVDVGAGWAKAARAQNSLASRLGASQRLIKKSRAIARKPKSLQKQGWGAAATVAKAKKPLLPQAKKKPTNRPSKSPVRRPF